MRARSHESILRESPGAFDGIFVGSWGGHVPDFTRQPVPVGRHRFVLAISGDADNYGGWARALHKEAKVQDSCVYVASGQTTIVELRLTIGPPVIIEG